MKDKVKGKGRQELGEAKDQVRDARRAVEKGLRGDADKP